MGILTGKIYKKKSGILSKFQEIETITKWPFISDSIKFKKTILIPQAYTHCIQLFLLFYYFYYYFIIYFTDMFL